MTKYQSIGVAAILGTLAAVACSSDSNEGDGVGTPCSDTAQCTGYENPVCNDALKPLEDLVEDTGEPENDALRDLTLPFPGGYCGTSLDTSCTSDAACGATGGCFIPFEGVDDMTIENLNGLGLPFDIREFASIGICLQPCSSDAECRTDEGYTCVVPFAVFLEVVNPPYEKTFCVQDVDVSALLR